MQNKILVMVAGDFGKLHEGHRQHIIKSSRLGDYLLIVTHIDEDIRKRKGYEPDPLNERIDKLRKIIVENNIDGDIVLALDDDGTVTKTLAYYRPDIYAKGGDRKSDADMPQSEVAVCKMCGIKLIYGMGEILGQSRVIARKEICG